MTGHERRGATSGDSAGRTGEAGNFECVAGDKRGSKRRGITTGHRTHDTVPEIEGIQVSSIRGPAVNERPNRVLIAGSDPDRVLLLEEAFTEIDETRFARGFRGGWERTYAVEVQEAADELRRSSFDVVLFDQAAVMEAALPAFWALRRAAPDTPVVTLISSDDELLGVGLVKNESRTICWRASWTAFRSTAHCAVRLNAIVCWWPSGTYRWWTN